MTRRKIEEAWIEDNYSLGAPLCEFLLMYPGSGDLYRAWNEVWNRQGFESLWICDIFISEDGYAELSYLCRALSLNMLLDDNKELL